MISGGISPGSAAARSVAVLRRFGISAAAIFVVNSGFRKFRRGAQAAGSQPASVRSAAERDGGPPGCAVDTTADGVHI